MEDEQATELDIGQFARVYSLGVGFLFLFQHGREPPNGPIKTIPVRGINLALQFFHQIVAAALDNAINFDFVDARQQRRAIEQELTLFLVVSDLGQKHHVRDFDLFGELTNHLRNPRSLAGVSVCVRTPMRSIFQTVEGIGMPILLRKALVS